jgi:octaprenyl-diphosphate synthase
MQRGSDSERATVRQAIETGDPSLLTEVVAIVKRSGALDVTRQAARLEAARAVAAAQRLTDTPYAACLIELASDLLERQA